MSPHAAEEKRGPSLGRRVVAGLVLAIAAYVLLKLIIGVIAAVAWVVVVIVAIVAVIWALGVLF
jgi:uncharacterized membrane protein